MNQDSTIEALASMRSDMNHIKEDISKIAEAMTRIAVLEEKHAVYAISQDKVVTRLERVEDRQRDSEVQANMIGQLTGRLEGLDSRLKTVEGVQTTATARIDGAMWLARTLYGIVGVGGVVAMLKYLGTM